MMYFILCIVKNIKPALCLPNFLVIFTVFLLFFFLFSPSNSNVPCLCPAQLATNIQPVAS